MTIIEKLKSKDKKVYKLLKSIATTEKVDFDELVRDIIEGKVVVLKNHKDAALAVAVGKNLKTKVNANIGTSPDFVNLDFELKKLQAAIEAKADTVMDLSTGGKLDYIRKEIIKNSSIPVGSVPIYQVVCETLRRGKKIKEISKTHIFEVIEKHAEDGISFITVHCGVTKKNIELLKKKPRVAGIVSRGGAFLAEWIIKNNKENPLYEFFDELLNIAKKYDLTLSLGDGLRPGSIFDANDEAQIAELKTLAELAKIANREGVQVMIEGPGHMPMDMIEDHIKLQKKLTNEKPYYLLGPLVTDIAAGYDHINSAIGAAIAAKAGADLICYVTSAEHLRLPNVEDVYEGVIAARIAAHAGDIVKRRKFGDDKVDLEMSKARKSLDWERQKKYALDKIKFEIEHKKIKTKTKDVCSMCGSYCAMRESTKIGI
ncbi:MAG: phosphomethylpyrimidine synthase ThiC [Elusimicrobiota bacterium]|nr:phosphomethylpyrimidine synthase ThiC [Endomicrobiia bacterium]MDW8165221.1 phosphomethylpyrimidine synthase ThiC [Elusimicrobiota bacterium]